MKAVDNKNTPSKTPTAMPFLFSKNARDIIEKKSIVLLATTHHIYYLLESRISSSGPSPIEVINFTE